MSTGAGDKARATTADSAQVELILSQIDALPTLSPVATQMLELMLDERVCARDLARLIESDPSLASRVLGLVRRADRAVETESVERAVVLLGLGAVRNLVLSVEIFETFSHRVENGAECVDRAGLWKHALAVGCAAQLLAEMDARGGRVQPEEGFLCGLLHDLGKVVLAACFPRTYDRAAQKADMCLLSLADVEREVFGLDHTIAGRRLALHWKLPGMVEECMWLHHQPEEALPSRIDYPEHVRIVRLADEIVRYLRIGYSGNHRLAATPGDVLTAAGLPASQADVLTGRLFELLEQRAEWIGLSAVSSREMFEEALSRANAQLSQANSSLSESNRKLQLGVSCFEALRAFKAALTEDPSHEAVCRAAAEAARTVLLDQPAGSVGFSPSRQVAVVAAGKQGADVHVEVLPWPKAASLAEARSADWQGPELLSAAVCDRLAAMMGSPPTGWKPILCQGRVMGAVAVAGVPRKEEKLALAVLADWAGSWLNGAESRRLAEALNEELAEMNRRLAESQAETARMRSLAMVGEMAAGAAHELNNPLAVISGRAQLLSRDATDEVQRKSAEAIAEHAHKASAIVMELMEFAKPAAPEATAWPIARLLGELRRDWTNRAALSPNQFNLTISDDVPEVWADASQVRKLFDEVIRNAVEAKRESAELRLNVNCWFDVADEKVVVRVEDNGVGMTPDVLERAMDPFFSHRPAGRGRGLGLSRAARYAEVNGGGIRLSSRPGEGTVVLVSLPATSRK